jgi:hypothetical protein
MADNDLDFIARAESTTSKLYGEPASIDQIADDFALYGVKKRAAALEGFDGELRSEIDSGSHSLRRRVQLMTLRQKMGGFMRRCAKLTDEKYTLGLIMFIVCSNERARLRLALGRR